MRLLKSIEKAWKKISVWSLRLIWAPGDVRDHFRREYVSKVIVVRPDRRMGNLLLITPLLSALRAAFPEARIDLIADSHFSRVLEGNPDIDHVIEFDRGKLLRNPLRAFRFIRRLRGEGFDLAVDASHMHSFSLTSGILARLSGAPFRLGYRRGPSDLFLSISVPPPQGWRHETEIYVDLVRSLLGEKLPARPMRAVLFEDERRYAENFFRAYELEGEHPVIGVHIGGRRDKRWPIGNFAKLIDLLRDELDAKVLVFWGPEEGDSALLLEGLISTSPVFVSPLPLRTFAALVERCDLFVSCDTGPMHLAVALNVPTVAIFLVDNYRRYGPLGRMHRIAFSGDGDVRVEDVLLACKDLIDELQAPPEQE